MKATTLLEFTVPRLSLPQQAMSFEQIEDFKFAGWFVQITSGEEAGGSKFRQVSVARRP